MGTSRNKSTASSLRGSSICASPKAVCLLSRLLYRQALEAWFNRFIAFILTLGFIQSKVDASLFVFKQGCDTGYLLLYVDDIILSASTTTLLAHLTTRLKSERHQGPWTTALHPRHRRPAAQGWIPSVPSGVCPRRALVCWQRLVCAPESLKNSSASYQFKCI
jgi:hypothetical protein